MKPSEVFSRFVASTILEEYRALCRLRKRLEADAVARLAHHPDFQRLQTLPGVGPVLALRSFWPKLATYAALATCGSFSNAHA